MKCKFTLYVLKIEMSSNSLLSACWEIDSHKRPQFKTIMKELEDIAVSGFMQTPHESFHNMQDCWKKEIAEVLHELRLKEKVSFKRIHVASVITTSIHMLRHNINISLLSVLFPSLNTRSCKIKAFKNFEEVRRSRGSLITVSTTLFAVLTFLFLNYFLSFNF